MPLNYPVLYKTTDVKGDAIVAQAVQTAINDAEQLWNPEKFDGVFPVKGFGIRKMQAYDLAGISSPGMNYTNSWIMTITTARTWTNVISNTLTNTTYCVITGFWNMDSDPDVTDVQIIADGVDYSTSNIQEAYTWDVASAYFAHAIVVRPEKKILIYVKANSTGLKNFGFLGYTIAKRSKLIERQNG